jgi:DNA/RNA-binding domain of Phe-tRNA-synthetase-like protein
MKFKITDEIFAAYPLLRIGVVVGVGLQIRKRHPQLPQQGEELRGRLIETVGDQPLSGFANISAWRETYRSFGSNPRKFKPTAEAFISRILKGKPFPNINTAVDAYLLAELETMLPIGGYDLKRLSGDIALRRSPGEEPFVPLGSEGAEEYTSEGEIVYADNDRVLTRNWNYRDCELTKISEETTDIVLACEAASRSIDRADVQRTLAEIVKYESMFCGGEYRTWILDIENRETTIA